MAKQIFCKRDIYCRGETNSFTNGRQRLLHLLLKRLLYYFESNFFSYSSCTSESKILPSLFCVHLVDTCHLRKDLRSPHKAALRLRTRTIVTFYFDRIPESKTFSFYIFFTIPRESGLVFCK